MPTPPHPLASAQAGETSFVSSVPPAPRARRRRGARTAVLFAAAAAIATTGDVTTGASAPEPGSRPHLSVAPPTARARALDEFRHSIEQRYRVPVSPDAGAMPGEHPLRELRRSLAEQYGPRWSAPASGERSLASRS